MSSVITARGRGAFSAKLRVNATGALWVASSLGTFVIVWLLLTSVLDVFPPTLLPSPDAVLKSAWQIQTHEFAGATLVEHALITLKRALLGIFMGAGLGLILGSVMGWWRPVNDVISPPFELLRQIPPIAWIAPVTLWVGLGLTSQIIIVAIAAMPPILLNARDAFIVPDQVLIQAARNLGAGRIRQLISVALPAGLPVVISGLQISISNGMMALAGAELLGARSGLGFLISMGGQSIRPDIVITGMLAIGLMGFCLSSIVQFIESRFIRWA